MEELLNIYYADNAKKLHGVVDRILVQFGGLSDKDMDDFYSLANEVFVEAMRKYDNLQSFDVFLFSCLANRIKTEMTKRNAEKRKADRMSVSIDMAVGDDGNTVLADLIADNFDLEREVLGEENRLDFKVEKYMDRLSKRQRRIVELLAASYGANEIQKAMRITPKEYTDAMSGIHAYENVSVLF